MKVRNFIVGALVALVTLASCQKEVEQLGFPKLKTDTEEVTFDVKGGSKSLSITTTRDWTATCNAEWLVVSPGKGTYSENPQRVKVTVLENKGYDREAEINISINMVNKIVKVKQAGAKGSAEQLILFYNDFDKEEATQTFGSGTSWPYLDQFEGWKNEKGSGAANVTYSFKAVSARANSTSNSNYSDYEGSGSNNMFFGSNAYIAVNNIALNGNKDLKLTFGTEKYSQSLGSVFTPSEYHIYLSKDGSKWVEFTDYTFAGGETEGRWNIATAVFSVPANTENLSICMKVDAASSYRMDDFRLEVSDKAGAAVDFSKAVDMNFSDGTTGGNQGGDQGGTTPPPAGDYIYFNNYDKAEATKTYGSGTSWPYLDQFEGWKNATGSGAANVTYTFSGISARANAESNGTYSDYTSASGKNNLFFGANAYIATRNIALNGAKDLVLTFVSEKSTYNNDAESVFKQSEFHIYLSNDGSKWVELTGYTFAGGTTPARWNLATATFSVPANTANLSIAIKADVASVYRLDDLGLAASATAGTAVDFSNAVDMDFGSDSTGGGNEGGTTTPPEGGDTTVGTPSGDGTEANPYNVAAILKKYAESGKSDDIIYLTGTIVEFNGAFPARYDSADVYLSDGTSSSTRILVYHGKNFNEGTFAAGDLKVGDKVVFKGKLSDYNSVPQLGSGVLVSLNGKTEGGTTTPPEGGDEGGTTTPPAGGDTSTGYVKLTAAPSDWSGSYLIVYETEDGKAKIHNGKDGEGLYVEVDIVNGKIAKTDAVDACLATVATMTGGYSIKIAGQYMTGKGGNNNGTAFGADPLLNTISLESDGVKVASKDGNVLRFNKATSSGNNRFRYYKAASYTSQQPIQFYKLQ